MQDACRNMNGTQWLWFCLLCFEHIFAVAATSALMVHCMSGDYGDKLHWSSFGYNLAHFEVFSPLSINNVYCTVLLVEVLKYVVILRFDIGIRVAILHIFKDFMLSFTLFSLFFIAFLPYSVFIFSIVTPPSFSFLCSFLVLISFGLCLFQF